MPKTFDKNTVTIPEGFVRIDEGHVHNGDKLWNTARNDWDDFNGTNDFLYAGQCYVVIRPIA